MVCGPGIPDLPGRIAGVSGLELRDRATFSFRRYGQLFGLVQLADLRPADRVLGLQPGNGRARRVALTAHGIGLLGALR